MITGKPLLYDLLCSWCALGAFHQGDVEFLTTFVDRYRRNLITAFRELSEAGHLEIMACGATHGYLPLMNGNRVAQRAQIQIAVDEHLRLMGRKPQGFWLPECAYEPGVDQLLHDAGVRYFLLDTHGILYATPRPRYV